MTPEQPRAPHCGHQRPGVARRCGLFAQALWLGLFALVMAGCRDGLPAAGADGEGDLQGSSSSAASDCGSLPMVAGPAEPCCPEHGADACGANLFCAAFDGRTVPTCYVVGSQISGAECGDDSHCGSQSCNTDVGICRGTLASTCDEAAGCIKSACYEQVCEPTSGMSTAICDSDAQCGAGMSCQKGRCGLNDGAPCQFGDDARCASRFCETNGSNFGSCASCQSAADCKAAHRSEFEVCEAGRCLHTCKTDIHCEALSRVLNGCAYVGSGCLPWTCSSGDICR